MQLNLLAFLLQAVNLSRDVCRNLSFTLVINLLTLLMNMLIYKPHYYGRNMLCGKINNVLFLLSAKSCSEVETDVSLLQRSLW